MMRLYNNHRQRRLTYDSKFNQNCKDSETAACGSSVLPTDGILSRISYVMVVINRITKAVPGYGE